MSSQARRACIDLLLRYENDAVIVGLVGLVRSGVVRPSKMIVSFSCN